MLEEEVRRVDEHNGCLLRDARGERLERLRKGRLDGLDAKVALLALQLAQQRRDLVRRRSETVRKRPQPAPRNLQPLLRQQLLSGRNRDRPLHNPRASLRLRIEPADRLNLVAKQVYAKGLLVGRREDIEQPSAKAEGARILHHRGRLVAGRTELFRNGRTIEPLADREGHRGRADHRRRRRFAHPTEQRYHMHLTAPKFTELPAQPHPAAEARTVRAHLGIGRALGHGKLRNLPAGLRQKELERGLHLARSLRRRHHHHQRPLPMAEKVGQHVGKIAALGLREGNATPLLRCLQQLLQRVPGRGNRTVFAHLGELFAELRLHGLLMLRTWAAMAFASSSRSPVTAGILPTPLRMT